MVLAVLGLHHHIIDAALHRMVDQVVEDVCHGALIGGAGVLQPKWHDGIVEIAFGCSEAGIESVEWVHLDLVVARGPIHE
jgi:hypothetical protein